MKASSRSAASYEDTLSKSIVALQKVSPKHDQVGSGSGLHGGSQETRTRARAGSTVHARGSCINALRVIKSEGGAGMLDEGFEVRDVRRAIAQTLKAKGAEKRQDRRWS